MRGMASEGRWLVVFTLCFTLTELVAGLYNFTVFETKLPHEHLAYNCSSIGLELAKVDSQEKWDQAHDILTNYQRRMPEKDIYIGLYYNASLEKFFWEDGEEMTWTKWYYNEPFNAALRPCVVLAIDGYLQFRTVDCQYELFYACSKEIIPTTTPAPPTTQKMSASYMRPYEMVTGLTVGFFVFGFILALCVLMCWCCFFSNAKLRKKLDPVKVFGYSVGAARSNKSDSSLPPPVFTKSKTVGYDNPMMKGQRSTVDDFPQKSRTAPFMKNRAPEFDDIPSKPNSASSYRSGSMNDSAPSSKDGSSESFGYMM
ncbi:uncharacterized protein LOC110442721 [Mizuhopecten yessoensis]|uniref:Macrophage mannose receptor 1 n=1 Tax=Mizuhopecten yessoensis TaxID=6573 RepID=A0A210PGM2_MIZYE|nr:uncharacterized protein LOC110442721 [Mizuhopecten yessoensis]OWF35629.1 Macrophage mannose receptor 1 [Mizuhopecten yessoensis]